MASRTFAFPEEPLITIFTPSFNRCHTLQRVYASLVFQDYKNLEWLIIDDGSMDGTAELIQRFLNEYKLNIRYYYQENAGKQAAWNRAIDIAAGVYFCCLDSDDAIYGNNLGAAIKICQQSVISTRNCIGARFSSKAVSKDGFTATGQELFEGHYSYFEELASRFFEERLDVLVTAIARNFHFPTTKNTKFIPEVWFYVNTAAEYYTSFYSRLILRIYYTDHRSLGRSSLWTHAPGHFISRSAMLRKPLRNGPVLVFRLF